MVAEWAKRLLPESSFPVKDFDVEGMSITKEAAREAVKRVSLEQALTQQRGYEPAAWMVEWTDNAGDPTRYIAYCEEDAADKLGVLRDGEAATAKVIPLYTTPRPSADAPWPKGREAARIGDMHQRDAIRVGFDGDNDVHISVSAQTPFGSVEFCTPSTGGGKSPRTREALIALMVAIEQDNAEDPSRDWWKRGVATPE